MAVGNTFGATALSSYGGFWISVGIVLTPGGFGIIAAYTAKTSGPNDFNNAFGFFLAGWFIFTTILLICTLRSTVAFFLLFFTLDMAFLFLFVGHLHNTPEGATDANLIKAGGYFGLLAAFLAWYNALAGIADDRYAKPHFPSPSTPKSHSPKNLPETFYPFQFSLNEMHIPTLNTFIPIDTDSG